MKNRKFTDAEESQIRKVYEAGFSLHSIGDAYKCAPDTVKAAVIRAGGETRSRILLTPEDDQELREHYEAGTSTTELADMFGHSDATIARAIRRAGGDIRPVNERYKKFSSDVRRAMAAQYRDGDTGEEIAADYGCCADVVYNAVREQGWEVRSTGEARQIPHSKRKGIEGKVCQECGEWHPLSAFHRALANADGLRHRCRQCSRELAKEWRSENPKKVRDNRYSRRLREEAVFDANVDVESIFDSYGGRCVYCGAVGHLTIDHVVPLNSGGAHTHDNIVPACRSCNSSKADTPLLVWLARGGPPEWRA